MTREEIIELLSEVQYPEYTFEVLDKDGTLFLQAHYDEPDIITRHVERQHTRKWHISEHAVKSEIVQTAFKCVMTSQEHRVREHFLYKGERIFGPHFDCDALVEIARAKRLDYRGRKKERE